jgi:hypothetical protein
MPGSLGEAGVPEGSKHMASRRKRSGQAPAYVLGIDIAKATFEVALAEKFKIVTYTPMRISAP